MRSAALCPMASGELPHAVTQGKRQRTRSCSAFHRLPTVWTVLARESSPLGGAALSQCRWCWLFCCVFPHCFSCWICLFLVVFLQVRPTSSFVHCTSLHSKAIFALEHMLMWFPPIGFLSPSIQIHSEYYT